MPRRALLLAITLLAGLPGLARGQERLCEIDAPGRSQRIPELGDTIVVVYDPFTVVCDDGATLQANSGRYSLVTGEVHLLGDVFFQDAERSLSAAEATYNRVIGRLWARQDVVFTNRVDGSTLEGPELEYFRANENRPLSEALAPQRSLLTLPPPEDSDEPDPLVLVADRLFIVGEEDLSASGSVEITRADLIATSEEAAYNSATEDLELRQDASIQNDEFHLMGQVVQAQLTDGEMEYVRARTGASLEGEDLHVTAADLQLFFAADLLQRAVAASAEEGGVQAVAQSPTFRMNADSLDASFVDDRIDQIHAIGRARAETIDTVGTGEPPTLPGADTAGTASPPDGVRPDASAVPEVAVVDSLPTPDGSPVDPNTLPIADATSAAAAGMVQPVSDVLASDWIRGDTIIGYFETVAADSAGMAEATAFADSIIGLQPDLIARADSLADDPSVPERTNADLAAAFADSVLAAQPEVNAAGDTLPTSVSANPADAEEPEVELRRLVAIGSAQSHYRMAAEGEGASDGQRNVNFLVGDRIELILAGGELQLADVTGLRLGLYMEAEPPASADAETPADAEPAGLPGADAVPPPQPADVDPAGADPTAIPDPVEVP